jgi:hypothetical protein
MLEIGSKYPHVRVWKSHTGEGYTIDSVKKAATKLLSGELSIYKFIDDLMRVSYGFVGQTDLSGIRGPDGKGVYIEIKTGTGRLSAVQKKFREMIISHGGIHIECRKLEDLIVLNHYQGELL